MGWVPRDSAQALEWGEVYPAQGASLCQVLAVLAHRYAQGNEGGSHPSPQGPRGGPSLFPVWTYWASAILSILP